MSNRAEMARKSVNWVRNMALPLVFWLVLHGCAPGKHSFLIVQTCLSDEHGFEALVREMKSIGAVENMNVVDHSEDVARLLEDVSYPGKKRTHGSRVIDVSIQRPDGVGVTASNLGLPGFEMAFGFSEGSDAEFAHAFADRVMTQLSTHWNFVVVPSGAGAKPKGGCP